ncbi:MAG: hypothetical protein HFH13_07010 [Dorea sp.]|nr:hypothetical protein [Dorea sp.]
MSDKKLDLILSKVEKMEVGMQNMKSDMQNMKFDMQDMKSDIQGVKKDICSLESKVDGLDRRVRSLELHIENATDRNIQLLAENFVELTKKLNQAIPVADKNYAYEVKVNYLIEEVQEIQKRMKAGDPVTA